MTTRLFTGRRSSFVVVASLMVPFWTACSDPVSDAVVLTAELPLHLEDHLDMATIQGSEVPADLPEAVEWRFDAPQPDWKLDDGKSGSGPAGINRLPYIPREQHARDQLDNAALTVKDRQIL